MTLPSAPTLWASLPVPAILIDGSDHAVELNPAAEQFLNVSTKALKGQPLFDRLAIDAPLEEVFARVRTNQSSLYINDVDVGTGERAPVMCNLQAAPVARYGRPCASSDLAARVRRADRARAGDETRRPFGHRHGRDAGA